MRKKYFKQMPDSPAPLELIVQRKVRFQEADPMGVVWHGRYPSWLEDAREALGNAYNIGYLDFYANNTATPIKEMHIDYNKPLVYPETYEILARLYYTRAARLNYEFLIKDDTGQEHTRGYSVQLFVDLDKKLMVVPPDFYLEFLDRWQAGELDRV